MISLKEAKSRCLPGWNIRCNLCGSYGAEWHLGERLGWGALALCPEHSKELCEEYRRHRYKLSRLRTINFEQDPREHVDVDEMNGCDFFQTASQQRKTIKWYKHPIRWLRCKGDKGKKLIISGSEKHDGEYFIEYVSSNTAVTMTKFRPKYWWFFVQNWWFFVRKKFLDFIDSF
jgi:hypothetical protein